MHHDLISTRPSIPADTQTSDHAQPLQASAERMQPPRIGALPYTREDYRALPDEEKNAALDFMIEGIIPDTNGAGSQLERTKRDMQHIVSWCIEHGEERALEFLYRQSGASDMPISSVELDRRAVTQILPILKAYPQVKLKLCSVVIHEDTAPVLAELIQGGRLAELDINCHRLRDSSLLPILQALQKDTGISCLCFNKWKLQDPINAEALKHALTASQSLLRLTFNHCALGPEGWKFLCAGLRENHSVATLVLRSVDITDDISSAEIGNLLASSTSLESITLRMEENDADADAILGGLGQSRSIRYAHIAMLGRQGDLMALALSKCIASNQHLEKLLVDGELASPPEDEVKAVAQACIERNTNLLTLLAIGPYDSAVTRNPVVLEALRRNAALLDDRYMRKAAAVFSEQPFGAPAWLPEGPSDILAQHLLMQHNSIADFDKKMEQVKFALNEQSRQTLDHAEQ